MNYTKKRVIIENVSPEIDEGCFPARRAIGEKVRVNADIFADGHDLLTAELLYRKTGSSQWKTRPMFLRVNDRWEAFFPVNELGGYEFTIEAWIDRFRTWKYGIEKKSASGMDISLELKEGSLLVHEAAGRAEGRNAELLKNNALFLDSQKLVNTGIPFIVNEELSRLMSLYPDKRFKTEYARRLPVIVERPRARFSAWYEMFPRSCSAEGGRHGTFQDCIGRIPYISEMGFDVLYFPPIHPIGKTNRKGKNNRVIAGPEDPGSPWAIGSEEGGHRSIHPQLGTLEDFKRLIAEARKHGIEIAIDIAFQCSPDHPYVKKHRQWFRLRPDNSIQFAENPPKKYEDIYPFDFETEHAESLWSELLEVVRYWIEQGVHIFRVDNPHTKPLPFWQWLIAEIKNEYPDIIFLSEAFTRPKTMYRLAKSGFTQSYTYFTWRNLKWEIEQYFKELTGTAAKEFFWPNLWPNTPDILPEYLQLGGRPAFLIRLTLAATLSTNYGIYGPAFELCINEPREPFGEEYQDSEKYEIHHWNLDHPGSLKPYITRINRIRRENPALQQNNLMFHPVNNEDIICYSKHSDDYENIIVVVVNLDPHHTHSALLNLPVNDFGLDEKQTFQMHDLISNARYMWHAGENYLELDPKVVPAHIFRIRRRVRSEHDFDYFM
ncbi:MAG: alpha-1,4-glucan--maltose-1-phosphate maltosyltransferase [Desulfobacterales bacterium]